MLFAGVLLWGGYLEVAQELSLRRDGVRTDARVMARRIEDDPEDPKQLLTLQYEASMPGSPPLTKYQADVSVGALRYEQLAPGEDVGILHSRIHPRVFRLADSPPYGVIFLTSLTGLFISIVGVCLVVGGLWSFWVLILLACRSDIQHGWLVDRWEETTVDNDTNFCVSYRFLTASGDQRLAAEVNRRAFHQLRPGSPVQVRAVRGRPEICWLQL
jgi:hypothetical protein